jgi:hypothetical protein
MDQTTLMYQKYESFPQNIESIIQIEKEVNEERYKKYTESKKNIVPDFQQVSEEITYVLNESFKDVMETQSYENLFKKDRWTGLGYIFILIYLIYFIHRL